MKKQREYSLVGKKLLFIGASGHFIPAIEAAKELGVYTIAINYAPNSQGKKYADMSAEVDTYNPEEVLAFAREQKVDGVFTSWNEVNIYTTEYVAKKLGVPFYGTREQLDKLIKKNDFKNTCREYGVPTVPEYFMGKELTQEIIKSFEYPVIFKPIDSGGTRGMTILYNEEGIVEAYEKAIDASIEKKIIVEKYLKDTKLIVIDFAVQNGKPYIVSVADRSTVKEHDASVPLAISFMYPSDYIDMVESQVLDSLRRMIKGLGIQNGIISMEGMISEGQMYIIETQFRFGGTHNDKHVELDTGVDLMKMMVELALTGQFDSWNLKETMNPRFHDIYATQNLQMNPGTISSITGIEEVKKLPGVNWFIQLKGVGDKVLADGSTARNFAKIGLSGNTRKELYRLMDKIQHMLDIRDEIGNNMVICNIPEYFIQ